MPVDEETMREGEWRLRGLLPKARKLVDDITVSQGSGLGESIRPFLYEANFRAMIISPGKKGGWIADLVLKDTPPGTPNVFGSAVGHPFETKSAAIDEGITLLAIALKAYSEDAPSKPVFLLHEFEVFLQPEILKRVDELRERFFPHGMTEEVKSMRKDALLSELKRCGLDRSASNEQFKDLQPEQRILLLSCLHSCAVTGILAYPFREAAAVGERKMPG